MTFPYELAPPIGRKGTLGLIVLQVDETIEQDFRRLFTDPQVALYVSRIPSGADLTLDTIAQMAVDLPAAAGLLPQAAPFGAVGYGCTSGTTLIGAARVAALVRKGVDAPSICDPLTAAQAALRALGVTSPGIVSPYIDAVAAPIRRAFQEAGFAVPASLSFGEEVESRVARIAPASIHAAAMQVGRQPGVQGVFISCTNLRTLDILDDLEHQLGLPVVSSNQALAWQMARASAAPVARDAPGRLLTQKGWA